MNINQKIKTMILLFLIISLNTYIGCKRDEKEGFIKGVVNGVLEIIPIEPIKDFLQEDVEKGEGGFEVLLVLAFSIFKLIILIGVIVYFVKTKNNVLRNNKNNSIVNTIKNNLPKFNKKNVVNSVN